MNGFIMAPIIWGKRKRECHGILRLLHDLLFPFHSAMHLLKMWDDFFLLPNFLCDRGQSGVKKWRMLFFFLPLCLGILFRIRLPHKKKKQRFSFFKESVSDLCENARVRCTKKSLRIRESELQLG